ncbi:glycoside hydrolase family 47 protein [Trichoderma cornu-damae]|uniref:Glycoside hydrolase family 47 protein n=1 Tax=Trichoderma cornu-damae TaxID=654480 RepID=A0A9P8QMG5_9HYPO|nr:glycoside hydrolase family 47 protein [Trichoderma cornu-damae]
MQELARAAHDEEAWRTAALCFDGLGDVGEGCADDALVGAAGALDDGAGRGEGPEGPRRGRPCAGFGFGFRGLGFGFDGCGQLSHQPDDAVQRHEEDDCSRGDEFRRLRRLALLPRPGADEDLVRHVSLRGGYGRKQGRAQRARHPGQDGHGALRREAVPAEVGELLAAAAVDEGVALLEAEHGLAGPGGGQGGGEELVLGLLGVAGELAGDLDGGAARDEVEHARGHQLVGEDEVGALDGVVRCAGEEVGVSRAAAGEDDSALWLGRVGVGVAASRPPPRGVCLCVPGVGLEQAMDVFVAHGGELLQRPVLAHLAEPAHPPAAAARVFVRDELVEQRALVDRVVQVAGNGRRPVSLVVLLLLLLLLLLNATSCFAEAVAGGPQVGRQRRCDLAADARGEFAAAAVGGDADLERAVRRCSSSNAARTHLTLPSSILRRKP